MTLLEQLANLLDEENAYLLRHNEDRLAEIRIRSERPLQFVFLNRNQILGKKVTALQLEEIVSCLMDNSLYSREQELKHGYFTTAQGHRVGVCGKTVSEDGQILRFSNVGSLCIRIPREIPGCAQGLAKAVMGDGLNSLLVISPPGMGKTTILRDLARILSEHGINVAIADERREIAACVNGLPTMNIGNLCDVMDGCPKAIAIPLLVRACAPNILIVDEIGAEADANALLDASRCGVKVIASAHGNSYEDVCKRKSIMPALAGRAFNYWALLGPVPGKIRELQKCDMES